jgi:transcriptional regulator with XRE-family HTH domain
MDPAERFARILRRERKRCGLSQEALGAKADVHRTEVSLLERGERDPRLSTVVRLARGLKISTSQLLDGVR